MPNPNHSPHEHIIVNITTGMADLFSSSELDSNSSVTYILTHIEVPAE